MKFMIWILSFFLLPGTVFPAGLAGKWDLTKSTLTYHVTHPLHKVAGKSQTARGKGLCGAKGCEFLVAVQVKSFDSGDGNRDAHMWETVKAGTYPMIKVHITSISGVEAEDPKTVIVNAEVEFAGQKVSYPKLELKVEKWDEDSAHLRGTLSLSLKAFNITPPSLLTMAVEDSVPVDLDLLWTRARN